METRVRARAGPIVILIVTNKLDDLRWLLAITMIDFSLILFITDDLEQYIYI